MKAIKEITESKEVDCKSIEVKENLVNKIELFSYDDFDNEDFFFGEAEVTKQSDLDIKTKINESLTMDMLRKF